MSPMILSVLQPVLSRLDILHVLQVLSGEDQATSSELTAFTAINKLLSAPGAGDYAWTATVDFLKKKNFEELALSYLRHGATAHKTGLEVPDTLEDARAVFHAIVGAVITNADSPQLQAVSQCPACNYVYGVMK